MATFTRFEEIDGWQSAREATRKIYAITGEGSFSRDYGLRDQIRRAGVSVMSNIAEGFESRTQALFIDFPGGAKGSAGEVRSQLYIALDCGYISADQFQELRSLIEKCSSQIYGLMKYLEAQPNAQRVRESAPPYDIG